MGLFIAEKPELAKAIVEALGGGTRRNGYYECAEHRVTWCFGHMLELWMPHDYDERYRKWSKADLPWIALPWKKRPIEKSEEQLNIILQLLGESDYVVHAGDPDPEGQLLVDEILEYAEYRKPVKRVIINDNNTKIVKRAIDNLVDNAKFKGESLSAEARGVCDLLWGVNGSRLYTLTAQELGYQGVLNVGRVQTPIMGLVVRRCRENAAHSAAFYYNVNGTFEFNGVTVPARYKVQDDDVADDKGRLRDKASAEAIAASVAAQPAKIASLVTTRDKKTPPPLPYNLLKLQTDASKKYGFKPDQVKDITQSLREKHKLITYNRSECEYLSDEKHEEAPAVLAAVKQTAPSLAVMVDHANPRLKSRAFNSKKVTNHHGIIPTEATANFAALSDGEQKIYLLIARAYIAQFWPDYVFDSSKIEVESAGRSFACTARVPKSQGWRVLYKNETSDDDAAEGEDELTLDLSALTNGAIGVCESASAEEKKTLPLPLYTMATLLTDLTRVSKYIKDDQLRAQMTEKAKQRAGEHSGIGTPATRDSIIAGLFEDGYLTEEKNGKTVNIVATPKAFEFYDVLPDVAKYPDMTALWHEQQQRIEAGEIDALTFVNSMIDFIKGEIDRVAREGLNITVQIFPCTKCRKPMRRIKTQTGGYFWACTDREACKHVMDDRNGKPAERAPRVVSSIFKCLSCNKGLIQRFDGRVPPGKKTAPPWWSCSGYPDCKESYPDNRGKPNYEARKAKA